MEDPSIVQSEPRGQAMAAGHNGDAPTKTKRARRPLSNVLSFVVGLVGVTAIGTSAWVYAQTQRDIARISSDIAQIRVSLTLFNQQQSAQPANTPAASGDDTALTDLANRLGILEENWRSNASAAPAALPPLPTSGGDTAATPIPTDGDCLPTGTRFMVAAGDSYPVCGTTGKVEIGAIDNGFITLADGTVIAQGGNIGLSGTRCMIGVVPSDGGSISGFAEIRVTC